MRADVPCMHHDGCDQWERFSVLIKNHEADQIFLKYPIIRQFFLTFWQLNQSKKRKAWIEGFLQSIQPCIGTHSKFTSPFQCPLHTEPLSPRPYRDVE